MNGGLIGAVNLPTQNSTTGVWNIEEIKIARQQGIWPPLVVPDPYFSYVTTLLKSGSTNGAQNNSFIDSSVNALSITRNGDTTQGSFNPYQPNGYWSVYFDGTGDSISAPEPAATAGAVTVELWINPITQVYNGDCFIINNTGNGAGAFAISVNASAKTLSVWADSFSSAKFSSNGAINFNVWTHVALVKTGGIIYLYVNGVRQTSSYTQAGNFGRAGTVVIGNYSGGTQTYTGYVSNARIVYGTAVYTGTSFTVPTTPLTAISGTNLLTCQSNRLIDNSSNAYTITRNGDSRVSKFTSFSPSAAWTAASYGGSAYFDGTGDFLQTTSSELAFGTGDFTIELWFNVNSVSNNGLLHLAASYFPASVTGVAIYVASNNISIYCANTASAPGGVVLVNTWNHVAVVRASGVTRLYLNGTFSSAIGAVNDTTNYTGTALVIGGYYNNTLLTNGFISNLRVVKGTAVYTSNFTPPTAPVAAITNTSLLTNFTNAGIFDTSTINNSVTVGNAQASSLVAKYDTTSLSFDGTGDWLTMIDSPEQRLGTGNFTIEFWLYLNSLSAARGIVAKGTGTTGWLVSIDINNKVVFTYTTSTITSTGTLSASTWYHIAVVREGTSTNQTKIYINGTNDGTGTVATEFNQTSIMYIGANRTGGDALNGYIDELRITNGYARYTSNFSVPTGPFASL